MIGIDHNTANIELREKFALTKSKLAFSLKIIKKSFKLDGVLILSTCNRFEIWFSNFTEKNLYKVLEKVFNINLNLFNNYFVVREGEIAVNHLFELTCGLKSKILGEDQILSQVKESLVISREAKAVDKVLEKLFQISITSGKKVKTAIRLTPVDESVSTRALDLLRKKFKSLLGINCLIIGNGEIGKLTAKTLQNNGLNVTMTLRQYKKGVCIVPEKCNTIAYDDRIKYLNKYSVIISATLSPHNTLSYNDVIKVLNNEKKIFIDLAVPRDIEDKIGEIESCELFDIDRLSGNIENKNLEKQIESVRLILKKYIDEFRDFYYYKNTRWIRLFN